MKKSHAYVEHWSEAKENNTGLLPSGDVGTGKSFFAGCIANALLDRDIPVLMTNFPTILNRLTGMFSENRAEFIASLSEYDLLIIDNPGVERSTEYAMEQMFAVIDCRYRSRKPMIITTNLKLEEIKNPPDLAHARIYDCILKRCALILFSGRTSGKNGRRQRKRQPRRLCPRAELKTWLLDNYPAVAGELSGKGVYDPMNNENMTQNTTMAPTPEDRSALVKKIGKTTYQVRVHFSTASTETMIDKIKRMLKNEVSQM